MPTLQEMDSHRTRLAHIRLAVLFLAASASASSHFVHANQPEQRLTYELLNDPGTASYRDAGVSVPATAIDVAEDVPGRVDVAWSFSFGAAELPALVAAIAKQSDEPDRLYVDQNRNQLLERDELAAPIGESGDQWTATVVAWKDDSGRAVRTMPASFCQLYFRVAGGRLQFAQAGKLVGKAMVAEQVALVQLEDRNANGSWSDAEDRLLVDLNGNGRFDPLRERFSCQGTLRVDGDRLAVAFVDSSVAFHPMTGTGRVVPRLNLTTEDAHIEELSAVLASTDGVHVTLDQLDEAAEVPVGTYTVRELRLAMRGDRSWSMTFSRESSTTGGSVTVAENEHVEFDLLGKLTLSGRILAAATERTGPVTIHPTLTTASGLFLSQSAVGSVSANTENRLAASLVQLTAPDQRDVAAVKATGFACGAFCPVSFGDRQRYGGNYLIILRFDSGPLAGLLTKIIHPHFEPHEPKAHGTR